MRLTRHIFHPTRPGLNMGAMIDVVFLLLIFFMCTTSFQPLEDGLSAHLPQISSDSSRQDDFEPIRIQLTGDADQVRITCHQETCESFGILKDRLKIRRAIADIPVIIAGQSEVPFEKMVQTMDACYEVGFTQVVFAAQSEE